MIQQIIFTVILAIGLLFPRFFIRVTEFWRIEKRERDPLAYKMTRILSGLAIALIWLKPMF